MTTPMTTSTAARAPAISRRTCMVLAASAGLWTLAGCSSVRLLTADEMFVSQWQLTQALMKRFPAQRNFMNLVDATAENPRLRMNPQTRRIEADLSVLLKASAEAGALQEVFTNNNGSPRQLHGTLTLATGLRFDAQTLSVRLADPEVLNFDFGPAGEKALAQYRPLLTKLATVWLQEQLDDYAIYTMPDSARGLFGDPKAASITVLGDGLLFKKR